jgi:hypothetical protein
MSGTRTKRNWFLGFGAAIFCATVLAGYYCAARLDHWAFVGEPLYGPPPTQQELATARHYEVAWTSLLVVDLAICVAAVGSVCSMWLVPWWRLRRARLRRLRSLCTHCGYDMRGTPGKCPECGLCETKAENEKLKNVKAENES